MKKLLALLLTSVSLFANDLYLYDSADKVELGEVIANKLNVLPTVNGKTYTLTNNLSVTISTNGSATYALPYRVAVYQKENSSAYFNETQTEYVNNFSLPEVVKIKDHSLNFSTQGELYVISESENKSPLEHQWQSLFLTKQRFLLSPAKSLRKYMLWKAKPLYWMLRAARKRKN